MQSVGAHLQGTGESIEESAFDEYFGSVGSSVLTLYKASTGGEDWGTVYQVIQTTGRFGSGMLLFFLGFVQFGILNIITGIFVDTAMKTLTKDSEVLAQEHSRQEAQHANKLTELCRRVDVDLGGRLCREEFEAALRRKHVPTLLTMLGFKRHHVLEFFKHMADDADDGEVDIGEFVKGCMLLKGTATNFDLHKLHAEFVCRQVSLEQRLEEILKFLRPDSPASARRRDQPGSKGRSQAASRRTMSQDAPLISWNTDPTVPESGPPGLPPPS